jgi:hypoxanthine phosphoribosyltransferase
MLRYASLSVEEHTMGPTQSFLTEQEVIDQSFRLGANIYASGFRPSFIVGLWRGGSAVGIYVQECLQTLGVISDHIAIRTSYQGAPDYARQLHSATPDIQVHGTQYLLDTLSADDKLLIVDDVFATGRNMLAVLDHIKSRLRKNFPEAVRIACLYEKPTQRKVSLKPDFVLHQTDDWLVLPYEIQGLSPEEIKRHKPFVATLAERYGLDLPSYNDGEKR